MRRRCKEFPVPPFLPDFVLSREEQETKEILPPFAPSFLSLFLYVEVRSRDRRGVCATVLDGGKPVPSRGEEKGSVLRGRRKEGNVIFFSNSLAMEKKQKKKRKEKRSFLTILEGL